MSYVLLFDEWYAARCVHVPGIRTKSTTMRADYLAYLRRNGHGNDLWQGGPILFARSMAHAGNQRMRYGGTTYYINVGLRPDVAAGSSAGDPL